MGEIHEAEFSLSDKINLPSNVKEQKIEGKNLIISPEKATWLVLNNPNQYKIYSLLKKGNNIRECLDKIDIQSEKEKKKVMKSVLTEIEVKKFYEETEPSTPKPGKSLILYLTQGCNLRCDHCYLECENPLENELSDEEFCSILDQYADMNEGGSVTLTGGEVLTRKDTFLKVLNHAYDLDLKPIVQTNGTLLTPKIADQITEKAYEVQVSIDGTNKDMHDKIRGKGTFKKSIKGLSYFDDSQIRVSVAMVPQPKNLDTFEKELPEFVEKLRDKVGEEFIVRLAPEILEGRNIDSLSRENIKFRKRVRKLFDDIYSEEFLYKIEKRKPTNKTINCGYGAGIQIGSQGECLACDTVPTEIGSVGNIKNHSLKELRDKLLEKFKNTNVDKMEECKDCDLRYFCGGGCKGMNLQRNGSILSPVCNEDSKKEILSSLVKMNKWIYQRK